MSPEMVGGRYRIDTAIGQGGMGTVWLAHDETLAREVAVKQVGLLPGESVTDSARALREARSTAALSHRNVVTVFDVVEEGAAAWLVMEHVPSRSLSRIIREEGPLPESRVADIGAQVADGLAAAHAAGIVHRDVKPGNVLVRDDGLAKISDFGIARTAGDPALTQTGLFIGTPAYFSPELARGGDPTPAADVWALGATLYAAVEGEPPYELSPNHLAVLNRILDDDPPRPRRAGALAHVLERMMDRDPATRWSMDDAAHALRRVASRSHDSRRDTATLAAAAGSGGASSGRTRSDGSGVDEGGTMLASGRDTTTGAEADATATPPPPGGRPRDERGRRAWPLLVALLAVLVVGALGYLALADDDAPADTPAADTSQNGDGAPSTAAPSQESDPSQEPSPTQQTGPPRAQNAAADDPTGFIEDYFATVPEDTQTGWSMLGPGMRSVGRDSYEAWWDSVADVQVSDIQPAATGESAEATLTYTMEDGRVETERHLLDLRRTGDGGWLIDGDQQV